MTESITTTEAAELLVEAFETLGHGITDDGLAAILEYVNGSNRDGVPRASLYAEHAGVVEHKLICRDVCRLPWIRALVEFRGGVDAHAVQAVEHGLSSPSPAEPEQLTRHCNHQPPG